MRVGSWSMDGVARLLSAALISVALVLSQLAHAQGSAIGDMAVTVTDELQASHSHDSDPSSDHDHLGGVDLDCAGYCPGVFVPTLIPGVPTLWGVAPITAQVEPSLTSRAPPTPERPPRA